MSKQRHSSKHGEAQGLIRPDLWTAITDYRSGRRYVWDDHRGVARSANGRDPCPTIPTVSREEMSTWRTEFLSNNSSGLDKTKIEAANRWKRDGLPVTSLPAELQPRWRREITKKVRQRLREFFNTLRATAAETEPDISAGDEKNLTADGISLARDAGDFFTVGQLLASELNAANSQTSSGILARVVAAWAAPKGPLLEPDSPEDLLGKLGLLSETNAAVALINAIRRLPGSGDELPAGVADLTFKLRDTIASIYGGEGIRSPSQLCIAAAAKLKSTLYDFESAVTRFLRTSPATAKSVSFEVLKRCHALGPLLIPAEREFLRDLEVLIGPAFRKLCEAYERNDDAAVLRRAPEFLNNIKTHTPGSGDPRLRSEIWNSSVAPILNHISVLIAEATSRGEISLAPSLELRNGITKADLRQAPQGVFLSFALKNSGRGHAHDVTLQNVPTETAIQLSLIEPVGPFDVPPGGEQLVKLKLLSNSEGVRLTAELIWFCQTSMGKEARFEDRLVVDQQVTEPNWDDLVSSPPYSLNPIKNPDRLYGRDAALRSLTLAAMSSSSKFVWGQKRIGKTSLLQVLGSNLAQREDTTCILLRMGEIASLHEGELARVIAQRLATGIAGAVIPAESEFGAGLGRLIPFAEALSAHSPARKFIVIIDEFDDLDPSFYTGERGKQFVKALRSLSEVGLTFFFVGSERMEAIFHRHQADLNKWTNIKLDRIDSRTDCRALIVNPVSGSIEFSNEAIDFIVDYCGGNPFYINNFCYQIFERCLQERRTFVDENDTEAVRHQLLRALGATNFSHFWEDNPILGHEERQAAIAENCVTLACISVLGGRYEDQEDLLEAQDSLMLPAGLQATEVQLRHACERLLARGILAAAPPNDGYGISLKIFREWLSENAVSKLVPLWTTYLEQQRLARVEPVKMETAEVVQENSGFIIPEDDILAVSQRLMFCGRQKDVAELRSWLRQFDDDTRIEIAFLLLKRLADKGFINEGAKSLALSKLEEIVRARRRDVGTGAWKIERQRLDNLCITYVDSELKSGATAARELRNMLRPGKSGPTSDLASWMRSHLSDDPMVVIVDDFAGTGTTLEKGINRFRVQTDAALWKRYCSEGRISAVVMFAFPEAIEHVRNKCQGVHVIAANTMSDELRACADDAGIFEDAADLRFAKDVLLQIGRELYPQAPLGFGDVGALVAFYNTVPNNTLPIFWSNGRVGDKQWKPIFPRP